MTDRTSMSLERHEAAMPQTSSQLSADLWQAIGERRDCRQAQSHGHASRHADARAPPARAVFVIINSSQRVIRVPALVQADDPTF